MIGEDGQALPILMVYLPVLPGPGWCPDRGHIALAAIRAGPGQLAVEHIVAVAGDHAARVALRVCALVT